MGLTKQQQKVIDAVLDPSEPLIKIKAVAGAGKTFTLVEAAKTYQPKSGIYLAYNKAIAEEATQKFKGTNIKCSTIHSLAYAATVYTYGLKVGNYNVRNVDGYKADGKPLHYKDKLRIVNHVKTFCLSAHLTPNDYINSVKMDTNDADIFEDHLNQMSDGTMACPHDFYLKLYHVLMASGDIPTPSVDMLLVDECGDINRLTLAIFKIIKAKKKIAVGDPMQNIYSFNETINAFVELQNEGLSVDLSESFRVSEEIASMVETFVATHVDGTFRFSGRKYPSNTPINTKAYISRNNSGLLEEMFRLQSGNIPFHTTRKVSQILELPLVLANLGSGQPINNYKYKHIEDLRKKWTNSSSKQNEMSIQQYVMKALGKEDEEAKRAFKVVIAHGPKALNSLTKYATECAKVECDLTLTTAHSSKGLEFSEVEIAPDLNDSVKEALIDRMAAKLANNTEAYKVAEEELRLYYVATTRAMVNIVNAKYLKKEQH